VHAVLMVASCTDCLYMRGHWRPYSGSCYAYTSERSMHFLRSSSRMSTIQSTAEAPETQLSMTSGRMLRARLTQLLQLQLQLPFPVRAKLDEEINGKRTTSLSYQLACPEDEERSAHSSIRHTARSCSPHGLHPQRRH